MDDGPRYTICKTLQSVHSDPVNALKFSPDRQYLASCSDDGTVVVLDYQGLNSIAPRVVQKYSLGVAVSAIIWHPDSQHLFIGLVNGSLHLLGVVSIRIFLGTGIMLSHAQTTIHDSALDVYLGSEIACLSLSKAGDLLAVGVGDHVKVLNIVRCLEGSYTEVVAIEAPDIQTMRQGESDEKAERPKVNEVRSLHFTAGGSRLLVTYLTLGIRCWNCTDHHEEFCIQPHSFYTGYSAIHPSEMLLACSNLRDGFDLYDLQAKAYVRTYTAVIQDNIALPAVFMNGGTAIALGTSKGTVRIVNTLTGEEVDILDHPAFDHVQALDSVEVSNELTFLATASATKRAPNYIKLWRISTPSSTVPNVGPSLPLRSIDLRTKKGGRGRQTKTRQEKAERGFERPYILGFVITLAFGVVLMAVYNLLNSTDRSRILSWCCTRHSLLISRLGLSHWATADA
ncbi:WD40-repeat-containing domain protein [Ephemerocybe angulata]|uniref:WD40-repeat-containing domain protein n=1 Tax=Ephemerocybe angulata TaxID=980116 RepID=A0A8H6LWY9_9AGAR|nr:WD40-repeat-containing domain protein [Tulosesus angulatus]